MPALATEHFTFAWYDETGPDAQANIAAVAATAEQDLATLAAIFGVSTDATWGPIETCKPIL